MHLLQFAKYEPQSDQLFLLGDYITFRENAIDLTSIRVVQELVREGAFAIRGNHEIKWMQHYDLKYQSIDPDQQEIYEFLVNLPPYILYPPYLFVHAGIRPEISLSLQSDDDLSGIRDEFLNSSFIPQEIVVFGHTSTFRLGSSGTVYTAPRKIGIDTGAKHGYRLSLVDLTNRLTFSCSIDPFGHPWDVSVDSFADSYLSG